MSHWKLSEFLDQKTDIVQKYSKINSRAPEKPPHASATQILIQPMGSEDASDWFIANFSAFHQMSLLDKTSYGTTKNRIKDTYTNIVNTQTKIYSTCWETSELIDTTDSLQTLFSELDTWENTLAILETQNYLDFEKSLELDKIGLNLSFPMWKKGDAGLPQVHKEDPTKIKFTIGHMTISEANLKSENLSSKATDEIQSEILLLRSEITNLKNKKLSDVSDLDELKRALCELALKQREVHLTSRK